MAGTMDGAMTNSMALFMPFLAYNLFHPPFVPCRFVFIFLFHLMSFLLQPCFRGIVCDVSPSLTGSNSINLDTGL